MGNDKVDVQMPEGEGHAFFHHNPWADIALTAVDRFSKKLGYLEGEPTLPALPIGEKLIVQP